LPDGGFLHFVEQRLEIFEYFNDFCLEHLALIFANDSPVIVYIGSSCFYSDVGVVYDMILTFKPVLIEDADGFLRSDEPFLDVDGYFQKDESVFHVVVEIDKAAGVYFEVGVGGFETFILK
jgi:hypothetical protein